MAGNCSAQPHLELECYICAGSLRGALVRFNRQLKDNEAVGEITCEACGFDFFRVIGRCPACLFKRRRRRSMY
jgi:hypothetical protein